VGAAAGDDEFDDGLEGDRGAVDNQVVSDALVASAGATTLPTSLGIKTPPVPFGHQ
jgi:hypothetical protein